MENEIWIIGVDPPCPRCDLTRQRAERLAKEMGTSLNVRHLIYSDSEARAFGESIGKELGTAKDVAQKAGVEIDWNHVAEVHKDPPSQPEDIDIINGLATTPKGFVFQSREVTWAGTGTMDLKTEMISLNAESKAREGLGIGAGSLAGLVHVRGSLANPTLELNPTAVAKRGLGVALAVGTAGLSVLAKGLLDRVDAETEFCKQIAYDFHERQGSGDTGK